MIHFVPFQPFTDPSQDLSSPQNMSHSATSQNVATGKSTRKIDAQNHGETTLTASKRGEAQQFSAIP
jgi:hypothetical protein